MSQNRTATMGTPCSPSEGDISACQDNIYLECDRTTQVWVRQNQCSGSCFEDPIFASNCYKIKTNSPSPTPTPSAVPSSPSGLSMGAVVGIVFGSIFVFACILLFAYFMFVRKGKKKESTLERKPTLNVLEKKYIVTMDYQPTASDEVKLSVGDVVILDLLFNDGWAKVLEINLGQE